MKRSHPEGRESLRSAAPVPGHARWAQGDCRGYGRAGEARRTGRERRNGGPVCCGNRGEGRWGRPQPPASSGRSAAPWACDLSRGGGAVGHSVTCRASPSGSLSHTRLPGHTPTVSFPLFFHNWSPCPGPKKGHIPPASMPQNARAAEAADEGAMRMVSPSDILVIGVPRAPGGLPGARCLHPLPRAGSARISGVGRRRCECPLVPSLLVHWPQIRTGL